MTDKHTQTLNGNRRITLQEQDLKKCVWIYFANVSIQLRKF